MKKQYLQNEEFEQVLSEMLQATIVQDEEIEEIIASPNLFNSIQTKINQEILQQKTNITRRNWFWNWQTAGAFLGILIVFMIGAIFYNISEKESASLIVQTKPSSKLEIQIPKTKTENIVPPPKIKQPLLPRPIVLKKMVAKPIKPIQVKQIQSQEEDFVPINFATDLEVAKKDGRIVRVQLSRASLLSLGVNLPDEGESKNVKTEFLISSDGIPKGVRLIK
ncbi:MAG TPA: hypothetical protein PKY82_15180 [Pyrinomonadaceae bacterium]|nr:hypothetical protein [Pyrinomonadaceae bacterium]